MLNLVFTLFTLYLRGFHQLSSITGLFVEDHCNTTTPLPPAISVIATLVHYVSGYI